ncbi:hypothetical protein VT84_02085 [Gemmata sp. SH-PL17]|nr:hypothetical protein VT84_02085 [Gemmata sp. SH-PL17]
MNKVLDTYRVDFRRSLVDLQLTLGSGIPKLIKYVLQNCRQIKAFYKRRIKI